MAPRDATLQMGALEGIGFVFSTGDEVDNTTFDQYYAHFPAVEDGVDRREVRVGGAAQSGNCCVDGAVRGGGELGEGGRVLEPAVGDLGAVILDLGCRGFGSGERGGLVAAVGQRTGRRRDRRSRYRL
jgi:hypothetical protein